MRASALGALSGPRLLAASSKRAAFAATSGATIAADTVGSPLSDRMSATSALAVSMERRTYSA
eukprot:3120283-Prymnesium_polylepis.1